MRRLVLPANLIVVEGRDRAGAPLEEADKEERQHSAQRDDAAESDEQRIRDEPADGEVCAVDIGLLAAREERQAGTIVVLPPPEILSPPTMQKSASTAPSAMRPPRPATREAARSLPIVEDVMRMSDCSEPATSGGQTASFLPMPPSTDPTVRFALARR